MTADISLIMFLGIVLIVATVTDLRFQKIPNILTFPVMVMAPTYHGITNGLDGLLFSAAGLALGIALLILPYLLGVMGAGDVKLMGAVGAILGARGAFIAFLFSGVAGGIYALIVLFIRRKECKAWFTRYATMLKTLVFTGNFIPIPAGKNEDKPRLFYGVAIASGTLFSVFLESSGYMFPI
jgi:prepilin peptidase CpaA